MKLAIDLGLKEVLKPELSRLNTSLEELARRTDGFLGDLLSYILIGSGKRVRPALVFLSSHLGPNKIEDVRVVAQSMELIHIATLVHDDVIDKAALRRGLKTVVALHSVDTSVLLGDHIYTYAFEKVAEIGQPEILKLMARSTSIMCSGEIEQLKSRYRFNITEDEYFSFIYKKTASLFGASARAGAILSGQPVEVGDALEKYGVAIGNAFQITDDLLDLTGEEAVVGKTLRTDLTNGKMTLPLIHYRNNLPEGSEKEAFIKNLQTPNGQIPAIIEQMKQSGSIGYAEEKAAGFVKEAMNQLSFLPAGKTRDYLTTLAEMLSSRKA